MLRPSTLLLVLLAACDAPPRARPTVFAQAPSATASLVNRLLDEQLEATPAIGRELGVHDYDGLVADYAPAGIKKRITMLEQRKSALAKAQPATADERLDVDLLRWDANEQLFWLVDASAWTTDPSFYEELFAVNRYLDRDYAPVAIRFARLVDHVDAAIPQLRHVRENLKPPLAKPLVDVAIGIYRGYAGYLRGDVARFAAGQKDVELRDRFLLQNEKLAAEALSLVTWLETVPTSAGNVLGASRFEKLVAIYAGEPLSLAELERIGEADLAKNRALYDRLAPSTPPGRTTDALALAKTLTEEARRFVVDHHVVTLATDERAVVTETPPYKRYNFAWLDTGGPFEPPPRADEARAFFYVTPPDPSWPAAQQASYQPTPAELRSTCVHEVYPGHFVQFGHGYRAPTRAQKSIGSATFIEGWAHYAEQMMVEEGFGDDPEGHYGQVNAALLRDCRLVVALGVHAKGMTMAQAEERFVKDCAQTEPVAREQARRAAFHPWYFAYTLGKLQILALREDARRSLGERFELRRFHDRLLAHGQGPLGLIRQRVLAELAAPP